MRKGVKIAPVARGAGQRDRRRSTKPGPGEIVAVDQGRGIAYRQRCLGELPLPPIPFPTPMVGLAVTPKSRGDEAKLSGALAKIAQEDWTFRRDLDAQTKEMVIYGMSELHLQILRERLKRRDKVEVETKEPKIPYRETIQANAEGMYRHKKQTGGRGQFGEVHIRMFPLPPDTNIEEYATKERFPQMKEYHYDPENNFLWVDSVVGGTIPGNFLPAMEKGFKDRLERGVIAGYKVQNVCVEVYFGKHHRWTARSRHSRPPASMAFRNVFQQAKPSLLEPIVQDGNHRARRQAGRHLQRHVGPPRPRAGHGLGRRRPADRHRRSALGRSDHLRPRRCPASPAARAATPWSSATTTSCPATSCKEIIEKAKLKEEEEE